ncbi:MAG: hypothetical protein NC211_02775 [Alistipes senegalensis]|nr:hypothetical protein [Oxalobacter formigenes]MCM1280748.1 hypothetical protein [Alistipes senegalensis]
MPGIHRQDPADDTPPDDSRAASMAKHLQKGGLKRWCRQKSAEKSKKNAIKTRAGAKKRAEIDKKPSKMT